MNSTEILEREFLEMRARILELAACLDRLDRADGNVGAEQKMVSIRKGIEILTEMESDRAKRIQLLFSNEYRKDWIQDYQLEARI